MIWIVSESVCGTQEELCMRHQYIEEVSLANVSRWKRNDCEYIYTSHGRTRVGFYQCKSDKDEYGINITAHIGEAISILKEVLTQKRAIVVINSCIIDKKIIQIIFEFVKQKNTNTELYFAKQEKGFDGKYMNIISAVGNFGFITSKSERLLFKNRSLGLIKAMRTAFDKCLVKV